MHAPTNQMSNPLIGYLDQVHTHFCRLCKPSEKKTVDGVSFQRSTLEKAGKPWACVTANAAQFHIYRDKVVRVNGQGDFHSLLNLLMHFGFELAVSSPDRGEGKAWHEQLSTVLNGRDNYTESGWTIAASVAGRPVEKFGSRVLRIAKDGVAMTIGPDGGIVLERSPQGLRPFRDIATALRFPRLASLAEV
jgi:hypothetical protein